MSGSPKPSLVSTTSLISGVVAGLVHTGLAVFLWNYWFDNFGEMLAVKPLNGLYIGLGIFLLGFVPAVFYAGQKVVSPAIIVAVFLVLSGVGSWVADSVQAPSAVPTPFALYILFWVGTVVLIGITGRAELRWKRGATG